MQFGSYVWSQDPEKLEISRCRETQVAPDGAGAWTVTDLGRLGRVVKGEGAFCGATAYASLKSLELLFNAGTEQVLSLDYWGSMMAVMTELTSFEEPCYGYVRYQFTFVETPTAIE